MWDGRGGLRACCTSIHPPALQPDKRPPAAAGAKTASSPRCRQPPGQTFRCRRPPARAPPPWPPPPARRRPPPEPARTCGGRFGVDGSGKERSKARQTEPGTGQRQQRQRQQLTHQRWPWGTRPGWQLPLGRWPGPPRAPAPLASVRAVRKESSRLRAVDRGGEAPVGALPTPGGSRRARRGCTMRAAKGGAASGRRRAS